MILNCKLWKILLYSMEWTCPFSEGGAFCVIVSNTYKVVCGLQSLVLDVSSI